MAVEPDQSKAKSQEDTREWEKLRPALKPVHSSSEHAGAVSSSARQADAGTGTNAAPWTSPLPQVAQASSSEPSATATGQSSRAESSTSPETQTANPTQSRGRAKTEAGTQKPRFLVFRRLIITLAVPVITLMVAVRTVASSAFLWAEYHRPGFPADTYGFDTPERMRLGSYGLDYILNLAPDSYLADIQTGGVAAFLPTEVEHMTDVKRVILYALTFAALMLVAALFSARTLPAKAPGVVRSSLFAGSWLTLVLIAVLGVSGLLGWESFFTTFHEVFFPQGNWQFRMSDTLIRLYPPQFWVDAALTAGIIVLLVTVTLMVRTWPTARRRQQALKRRAENQKA